MLAIPEKYRCIECGLSFGDERFAYYEGNIEHGAAYWCDHGLLCSPACSLEHHKKRLAEGTASQHPARDPLDAFNR